MKLTHAALRARDRRYRQALHEIGTYRGTRYTVEGTINSCGKPGQALAICLHLEVSHSAKTRWRSVEGMYNIDQSSNYCLQWFVCSCSFLVIHLVHTHKFPDFRPIHGPPTLYAQVMTSLWQQYIGIRKMLDPLPLFLRCIRTKWMAPNQSDVSRQKQQTSIELKSQIVVWSKATSVT